jgi:hypothetical protein
MERRKQRHYTTGFGVKVMSQELLISAFSIDKDERNFLTRQKPQYNKQQ